MEKSTKPFGWCKKEIIVAKENKGLAESITSGIDYMLETFEAVIILEDDCVTNENYIRFMVECLERYKENEEVFSISGYTYPIKYKDSIYDAYAVGRASSWGWGTWKDRWRKFEKDNNLVKKICEDEHQSRELAIWGRDLEKMLDYQVQWKIDSWAVYWALKMIEQGGYCITPNKSLIKNIGVDGSGVHCGNTDIYNTKLEDSKRNEFRLPEQICFSDDVKERFIEFYGGYMAMNGKCGTGIIVYGLGDFFRRKEKEINESYYVVAFVDMNKEGYYEGKKIISMDELTCYKFEKIVIMLMDRDEAVRVKDKLHEEYGISEAAISLGLDTFEY